MCIVTVVTTIVCALSVHGNVVASQSLLCIPVVMMHCSHWLLYTRGICICIRSIVVQFIVESCQCCISFRFAEIGLLESECPTKRLDDFYVFCAIYVSVLSTFC